MSTDYLETMAFDGCDAVIAVVDEDLFIPIFTYVLGEARIGGRCALISVYRLDKCPKRAVKLALHEFGHLMALGHCHDDYCAMSFSKDIDQLDLIPSYYCQYCMGQINYRIAALKNVVNDDT